MAMGGTVLARATSDSADRLISADEPLAGLQRRCGGELPGTIAVPALHEMVNKARRFGLRLARPIAATTGDEMISAWAEVEPADDGCRIVVRNWQTTPVANEDVAEVSERKIAIDRHLAELIARLDPEQRLLAAEGSADDVRQIVARMQGGLGSHWTDFVTIEGGSHRQPLHWRLLDGASVTFPGSQRSWRATLLPQGLAGGEPTGFELCLTADEPLAIKQAVTGNGPTAIPDNRLVGRDLAPVLRQPIARIIANAETIRTRMAGPLAEEYSAYAADIAAAGQHLLALVDDLADLEVVESEDFSTAPDKIDLADVARRAAGILGVRARDRGIMIDAPRAGETLPATAEFRRVLQVLLNLVGNAIRYSPANSQVWLRLESDAHRARIIVADQGPGLGPDQQARVFEKFERLGRSDEGGSGLGLYISRKLARAMGGELTVESAPGQGARFILELPSG